MLLGLKRTGIYHLREARKMLESEKLTRICHLREAHKEDSKGEAADPVGNPNEMEEPGESA